MSGTRPAWVPQHLDADRPAYLSLADALGSDVARGLLRQGDRLPTHRALAAALGVTPRTVARAYAEAERRGLVSGLVGSGTYVRAAFGVAPGGAVLDLASLHPPAGPEADPVTAMRRALEAVAAQPERLARAALSEEGLDAPAHRESAAAWVAHREFRPDPDDVVLTTGAQQALALVLAVLAPPGAAVVTTSLTNPGLLAAARALGVRTLPVAADGEGMRPDALDEALAAEGASVVYLQTTLANPTGASAGQQRREELAEVLLRRHAVAVEDDSLAPLAPERPAPLAALLPAATCHISSATKTLALGLRVGVLVAPAALQAALRSRLRATSWLSPPLPLEVFDLWVRDGTAEELLRARVGEVARRRRLADAVLPGAFAAADPAAPHCWWALPRGWDDAAFGAACLARGVLVSAGHEFLATAAVAAGGVRLALNDELDHGRLRDALAVLADLVVGEGEVNPG